MEYFSMIKYALRDIFEVGGATLLSSISSFILSLLIVRSLDPNQLGLWSSSLSIATIVIFFIGFGIPQLYLKMVASSEAPVGLLKICLSLLTKSFILIASAGIIVLVIADYLLLFRPELLLVAILLPFSLGQTISEFAISYNQASKMFSKVSFWHLVGPLARIVLVIVLIVIVELNSYYIAFAFSCAGLLVCFIFSSEVKISFSHLREACIKPLSLNTTEKFVIKNIVGFGAVGVLHAIYINSGIVVTRVLADSTSAGFYSAAQILILAATVIPAVIVQKVLMPDIHAYASADRLYLARLITFISKKLFFLGVIISCFIVFFASIIVKVLFGNDYIDVVYFLQVMSICLPFRYAATCYGAVLMTRDFVGLKVRILFGLVAINAIILVIILSYFEPKYSPVAIVFSDLMLMLGYYYFYKARFFK
jgi:O-antigen/teichoic acid export membrane protein